MVDPRLTLADVDWSNSVKLTPDMGFPFWSRAVAVNVTEPPAWIVSDDGDSVIVVSTCPVDDGVGFLVPK